VGRGRGPRGALAVAVCLTALLVQSCSPAAESGLRPEEPVGPVTGLAPLTEGVLRIGVGRDPATLDPRLVADDEGEFIARALFEGLVEVGPDGLPMPASAARWWIEDEGLTVRFVLRPSRFHDGTPVTASDHARAILGVFDAGRPPFARDDLLTALQGATVTLEVPSGGGSAQRRATADELLAAGAVEVVAPDELLLRLARPDPRILYELADVALMPVPPAADRDAAAFALQPVGNGPFRMLGPREPGLFIRLAAVEDHHRGPRLAGLVVQVYANDPDREQRWSDLVAGRLQVSAIPAARRGEAVQRFGVASDPSRGPGLIDGPTGSVYAYGFDVISAPFDDVRVRRALSLAIDRDRLATEVLGGSVDPARGLLALLDAPEDGRCDACRFDPVEARALIEAWAAEKDTDIADTVIPLTYPRGPGHVAIAERVASDLESSLGVRVQLQARDLGVFTRLVAAGEASVFRLGLRPPLQGRAAVLSMLDPAFRSGGPRTSNPTGYGTPELDELLDALRGLLETGEGGERAARAAESGAEIELLVRGVERGLLDAVAVIPLLWPRHDLVVVPGVEGLVLDPTGRWWPELVSMP